MVGTALKSCLIAALPAAAPTPDDMQPTPGVAKVEVAVQVDNPTFRIVHILDWHHVPREDFAADMRDALGEAEDEQIDEAYAKLLFMHGTGARGNDNTSQVDRHIAGLIERTYAFLDAYQRSGRLSLGLGLPSPDRAPLAARLSMPTSAAVPEPSANCRWWDVQSK